MQRTADRDRPLERLANRQALLQALLEAGSTTRVDLAEQTSLSRPTVNAIVSELVTEGLVLESGSFAPTPGRSAALYRINAGARTVIGVDLGGTKILGAVADLTGAVRATRERPTDASTPGIVDRLVELFEQILLESGLDASTLTAISIGVPGVPNPITGKIEYAVSIPELAGLDLRYELMRRMKVPVVLDNDVNMAIIGERWKGRAQQVDDAVFIAVGTGLGVGVVAGGRLQRGSRGAAGEVDSLPITGDPFANTDAPSVEDLVSARGIIAAFAAGGGEERPSGDLRPDLDVRSIFAEAERGSPRAIAAIDQAAHTLALVISSLQAILDPERIVLGGGIGSNPFTVSLVRSALGKLRRRPPVVEPSALNGRAALFGALAVALEQARASIGLNPGATFGA